MIKNINPFHYPARLLVALALTLLAIQANAATLTWSTTSGSTITDGSGTWTTGSGATGSPYWWNGTADVNWAANDTAIFGGTAGTAGTVTLGGSISATKITFNKNYTLDLAGNTLTTGTASNVINAGTTTTIISDSLATGGWNINTQDSTISNTAGGLVTVNAKITGTGRMYVGGGGNVILTNDANDFTGLLGKQNANALTISSIKNSGLASAAGAGNRVLVGDSGIIIYNGSGDSTDRTLEIRGGGSATLRNNGESSALIWTGTISNTSTANKTFTLGGSNTDNNELKGVLANNGSFALSVTKADAGTWVLSGNNTYTGATTISAGTLQIGAGGTSGAISSTSGISNNGTLAINRSDALTVSTIISGTGALKKNGAGTLTLTGNNTYNGGTKVSTGTLLVNNTSGSGTGSGSLLVSAGATLGGSGEIAGITTISGILAPGNSIGTLTVANDVTWNGSLLSDGTANWKFELGAANTADLLRITGGASEFIKGSGSVFCFDFLGSTETGTFTLVDWDSTAFVGGGFVGTSFAATDFTYTNLGSTNTGTFQFNGSQLQFQSIPEPSAGVLMVIAGTALFVLRRRRMQ